MYGSSGGKSKFDKWEQYARDTGQNLDDLIANSFAVPAPDYRVPAAFHYVMDLFVAFSREREYHSSGIPMPIKHAQINEYNQAWDEKLSRWEIYTLLAIDDVWLEQMANERAKQEQVK